MGGEIAADYLDGLPPEQAAELTRVNEPGLTALRGYLASGEVVAFLGAGVSAPLYPLWNGLIGDLVDAAASRLDDRQAAACRAMARESPEEVVEIIRAALGTGGYREVLRHVLRVRTDRGWAARADALHARLVPPGLDPNPLATVERLVAVQKRRQKGRRS